MGSLARASAIALWRARFKIPLPAASSSRRHEQRTSVVLTMRASRAEELISDSFAPAKPVPVLKSRSGPLRMPPPAFSLDAATQTRNRRRLRARCPRYFDPSLRSRCSLRQDDGSALALLAWFGEALRFLSLTEGEETEPRSGYAEFSSQGERKQKVGYHFRPIASVRNFMNGADDAQALENRSINSAEQTSFRVNWAPPM